MQLLEPSLVDSEGTENGVDIINPNQGARIL